VRYVNVVIRIAVLIALTAIVCVPAFSQGCALCYTQAASAGHKMIEALRSGILILVLPPTAASVGMLFIVHRKRNQIRRPADGETRDDWGQ
jgi:ABC-type sulfate transport system permease component